MVKIGFDDPQCGNLFHMKPKLFSKSESLSSRVMLATQFPNRLIYHQSQEYTFRIIGRKKVDSYLATCPGLR